MIDRNKYVVFKLSEFEEIMRESRTKRDILSETLERRALDHCVILRLQDEFAAPALDVYAAILSAAAGQIDKGGEEEQGHLYDLADYFTEMAEESRSMTNKKIPD